MPGRWYDEVHCHRIVYEAAVHEISLVPFPDDPRTYRMEAAQSPCEVSAGRPLATGEIPLCTHCTDRCNGAVSGPRNKAATNCSGRHPTSKV